MTNLAYVRKRQAEAFFRPDQSERSEMFCSLVSIYNLSPRMNALGPDERIAFRHHQNDMQSYVRTVVDTVGRLEHPFDRPPSDVLESTHAIQKLRSAHPRTQRAMRYDGLDRRRRN